MALTEPQRAVLRAKYVNLSRVVLCSESTAGTYAGARSRADSCLAADSGAPGRCPRSCASVLSARPGSVLVDRCSSASLSLRGMGSDRASGSDDVPAARFSTVLRTLEFRGLTGYSHSGIPGSGLSRSVDQTSRYPGERQNARIRPIDKQGSDGLLVLHTHLASIIHAYMHDGSPPREL